MYWNFPYSSIPLKSRELAIRAQWRAAARETVASTITDTRLDILTSLYWKATITKPLVSTKAFLKDLVTSIRNRYPLPCVQLRHDLIALLAQTFVLQTHAFTDVLNYSSVFPLMSLILPLVLNYGEHLLYTRGRIHFFSNFKMI